MEISSIIFVLTLVSFAKSATNQTGLDVDEIPNAEVQTRTTDYEVDLTEYCPNAPSDEAGQCVASYNLSQNVEQVLVESMVAVDATKTPYGKILQLTKCSIEKVPNLTFDLQIFCYFKGVKEFLLKEFQTVRTQDQFDLLMIELANMVKNETKPDFKDFYQDLLDMVEIKHSFAASQIEISNDKENLVTDDVKRIVDPTKIPQINMAAP